MSCNCNKAKSNTACLADYTIGRITPGSYFAYFKTPTGRIDRYPVVFVTYTDLLYVETPKVRIGEMYEIWINDGESPSEKLPFTIGLDDDSTEVQCVNVEFTACFSEGEDYMAPVNQEITLA